MSQHDFEIANQGFPSFRSDLNSGLQALASNSAGATEPSTTYAYQFWYDSTANLLKMRNTDNDAWITLAYFDQTNDEWEVRSAVIQAVDSAGVTIKDDSGTTLLAVADGGGVTITDNGASGGLLVQGSDTPEVAVTDTTNTVTAKLVSGNSVSTVGTSTNHDFRILTNGQTAMNIDTSQRVLIGHTTSTAHDNPLQIFGTTGADSSMSLFRDAPGTASSIIQFNKSRGTTGSPAIVQENDTLGYIAFRGYDGTDWNSINASIYAQVDAAPGSNDTPGRLVFATCTDGSSSPTERMRITQDGSVNIGTDSQKEPGIANTDTGVTIGTLGRIIASRSSGTPVFLNRNTTDGAIIELRKGGTTVGSINTAGSTDLIISADTSNANSSGLQFQVNNIVNPTKSGTKTDDAIDLGSSSFRWRDIYAGNGTIQTSDRNEKQDIEELSEAEQRVAVACKSLMRKFRWKSAVAEKGDDARIHFGIIAQDLQDAFEVEGLDASRYGMFTSNTWWEHEVDVPAVEAQDAVYETVTTPAEYDEDGNEIEPEKIQRILVSEAVEAKEAYTRTDTYDTEEEAPEGAVERTRLGVRYPELLAFIIAAI